VNKNISTIVTLYKTPLEKLNNLKQYKVFKLMLFEQEGSSYARANIKKILKFKFKYFFSRENIGLSKSSNFLFKNVKTRFFLFTQPDIKINSKSILALKRIIIQNKDLIFVTPNFSINSKIKKKNISFVKKINAACMMCDANKLKKIGFFDEDYFLYWEDIDLIKKINDSNYKMAIANNIFAKHDSSQSSENTMRIRFLRQSNFIYGELLYDFKHKKLRKIKIIRKLLQNSFLFFFNIFIFQLKVGLINLAHLIGVCKFIFYYLKKKLKL